VNESLRGLIEVDRLVHEPARLVIMALLYAVDGADFLFLMRETGLTKGNLSSHLSKLEQAGYVEIEKSFQGKMPRTLCRLTAEGRQGFEDYRRQVQRAMRSVSDGSD